MKNIILIFGLSHIFICCTDNDQHQESKEVFEQVIVYHSNNQVKMIAYQDSTGLLQREFKRFDTLGRIIESGYYMDDTIIGFRSLYDTTGKMIEKRSTIFLENEYSLSEFFNYKDSSDGHTWALGYYFISKYKSESSYSKLQFYSSYGDYDSIKVNVSSSNKNKTYVLRKKLTVYSDTFDLEMNFLSDSISKLKINFEIYTTFKNRTMIRFIERIYPVKKGKIENSIWDYRNE